MQTIHTIEQAHFNNDSDGSFIGTEVVWAFALKSDAEHVMKLLALESPPAYNFNALSYGELFVYESIFSFISDQQHNKRFNALNRLLRERRSALDKLTEHEKSILGLNPNALGLVAPQPKQRKKKP